MICTEMTVRAARIAEQAHHGQYDKSGMPYILHPLHLAAQMADEITAAIALLHDVIEDTDITAAELAEQFPPRVIAALRLLTHDPAEDYFDYIRRIRTNPDAVTVKRADLRHNLDESRLIAGTYDPEQAAARREKYRKALRMLESAACEAGSCKAGCRQET